MADNPDVIAIAGTPPPPAPDNPGASPQPQPAAGAPVDGGTQVAEAQPTAVAPSQEVSPRTQAEAEAEVDKLGTTGNYSNPFQQRMVAARQAGASWDQINSSIRDHAQQALTAGATEDQINTSLGFTGDPSNFLTMSKSLAVQHAEGNTIDPAKDPQSFYSSFVAGLAANSAGEATQAATGMKLPEPSQDDQSFANRIAYMLGVSPPMITAVAGGARVGAIAGAAALSETVVGAPVGAAIGSVVGAISGYFLNDWARASFRDINVHGGMTNEDAAIRLVMDAREAATNTAVIAPALAVGGPAAGALERLGISGLAKLAGVGTAEVASMAVAARVINGATPHWQRDIIDNAIMIGVLHAAGATPDVIARARGALVDTFANTGEPPAHVLARVQADPTVFDGATIRAPGKGEPFAPKAPDVPAVAPITPFEVPQAPAGKTLEDRLYGLGGNAKADDLQMRQYIAQMPKDVGAAPAEGGYASLNQKFYEHTERPEAVPLDAHEQQLYEKWAQPMLDFHNDLFKQARELKALPETEQNTLDPTYIHRRAIGVSPEQDQLASGQSALPQFGGKKLTKTAPALKPTTYNTLVDNVGNRSVVSQDENGRVQQHVGGDNKNILKGDILDAKGEPATQLQPGQTFETKDGIYKVTRSNTQEIEDNTNTRYYHDFVGNMASSITKLQRAIRNKQLTDDITHTLVGNGKAMTVGGNQEAPPNWVKGIPGFEKWAIDPDVADQIKDYLEGGPRAITGAAADILGNVNKLAVGALFSTPAGVIAHIKNLTTMDVIGRGWDNANMERTARTGFRAMQEVMAQGPDYIKVLRKNGALLSSAIGQDSLAAFVAKKMGQDIVADPERWGPIAKAMKLNGVADLGSLYMNGMSKGLYGYGDMLYMQRFYELKEKGLNDEDAIEKVEKYLPNYRMSSKVAGSRALAQAMGDINIMSFGRFTLAKFKAYSNMISSLKTEPGEAMGRFFAAGLMMTAGAYVMNGFAHHMANLLEGGDHPDAKFRFGGTLNLPMDAKDFAENPSTQKFFQIAASTFTPAIGSWEALQQLPGVRTDFFTKNPISQGGPREQAVESVVHAAKATASPEYSIATNWDKYVEQSLGVSSPGPSYQFWNTGGKSKAQIIQEAKTRAKQSAWQKSLEGVQ
jgi:hypothetical protein